jgi:hypothetical protein
VKYNTISKKPEYFSVTLYIMSRKSLIFWGMTIGSLVGGYIPTLWGAGILSMSGILLSGIGGFVGIWVGYRFGE